jgi:hypothetical protein
VSDRVTASPLVPPALGLAIRTMGSRYWLRAPAAAPSWLLYLPQESWNNTQRYGFNAVVTAQDEADTYLPAFAAAVEQAHVSSLMCRCALRTPCAAAADGRGASLCEGRRFVTRHAVPCLPSPRYFARRHWTAAPFPRLAATTPSTASRPAPTPSCCGKVSYDERLRAMRLPLTEAWPRPTYYCLSILRTLSSPR